MADVIKEFLVSLGFKTDAIGMQSFNNVINTSTSSLMKLGEELEKTSKKYESLSYGSERTGTTVKNLQAVAYAASRVGMSAEEGAAAMESFAEAMRLNPSKEEAIIGRYGKIQTDKAKEFISFIKGVKSELGDTKMGYAVAHQVAELAGIPEHSFVQMFKHIDKFEEKFNEFGERATEGGFDPETFAKKSVKFQDSLAGLGVSLVTFKENIYSGFIDPAQAAVEWLDKLTRAVNKSDWELVGKIIDVPALLNKGVRDVLPQAGVDYLDKMHKEEPRPGSFWDRRRKEREAAASPMAPRASADSIRVPSGGIPTEPKARRQFVADFYMREGGYSPEVAWAWAGNLSGETANFNPAQGGRWIRGKNGQLHKEDSYGAGQWHKERRDDFKNWSGHEMKGTDLLEQLRFSLYESTQGKYKAVGEHLKSAKTVRDAMRILVSEYERPADIPGNIRSRGAVAEDWFKADLGRRSSANGWGARTEPTDEQGQVNAFAQGGAAKSPDITHNNSFVVNINGITEPDKVRDALYSGSDDMFRLAKARSSQHLIVGQDGMR